MNMADDFSVQRVPLGARLPLWEVMLIRIGMFSSIAQFLLGSTLGYGMTFKDAFVASFLGTIILEVVSFLIGVIGAREGMATSLLTRWTGFGKYGSALVGLVFAIGAAGWFGVQNSEFAIGVDRVFHGTLGFELTALLCGLFVTLIVVFGFKWLSWTARIAVPLFVLVMGYGVIQVFMHHSSLTLFTAPGPGAPISIATGATMVAGSFMIGAVITPDMSRYCKGSKDVFWMTLIGTLVGEIGINLISVLMAHAVGSSDIMRITMDLTGWVGLFIVIFATVKINDMNLYASSLGVTNAINILFGKSPNRGAVTIVVGLIGTLASVLGVLNLFMSLLIFLGNVIPPISGIMLVDYFLLKRHRQILDDSRKTEALPWFTEDINWWALVSWAIGVVAAYTVHFGISALNSLIASSLAYYLLGLAFSRKSASEINIQNNVVQ